MARTGGITIGLICFAFLTSACSQQHADEMTAKTPSPSAQQLSTPPSPTHLRLAVRKGGIRATWKPGVGEAGDPATAYKVWVDTNKPVELSADMLKYAVAGLEPGSWHQVRVAAINEAGQSPAVLAEVTLPESSPEPQTQSEAAAGGRTEREADQPPEAPPEDSSPSPTAAVVPSQAAQAEPVTHVLRGTVAVGDINGALGGVIYGQPGKPLSEYDGDGLDQLGDMLDSLKQGETYPCPAGAGGGYEDIYAGTPVVIRDGDGSIVGIAKLRGGKVTMDGCVFHFQVEGLPDTNFYTVTTSDRGSLSYTRGDLVDQKWRVQLTIGG